MSRLEHAITNLDHRTHVPFQNPEWQKFKGKENRYPNQFGQGFEVADSKVPKDKKKLWEAVKAKVIFQQ